MPYNKLYQIQVWEGDCRLEKSSQIHILYVAQGACRLGLEDKSVPLGKGEVFLLNFRQEAQARLESGSLLHEKGLFGAAFSFQICSINLNRSHGTA